MNRRYGLIASTLAAVLASAGPAGSQAPAQSAPPASLTRAAGYLTAGGAPSSLAWRDIESSSSLKNW